MDKEKKIINYLKLKYKKKMKSDTKLFLELDIDSFEFVKLVRQIETKLKKKYHPSIDQDILNINLKKFSNLFK